MNYLKLKKISKYYFGYEELASVLGISLDAARVTASRYAKQGFLIRLKRNLYVLAERWDTYQNKILFQISNIIQTPSYISLMSALCYYEVSTQIQQEFVESISLNRTTNRNISGVEFSYFKIKKELYSNFVKTDNYFIATAEKAFIDALYLKYLGNYNFDISSIDFDKLNKNKLLKIVKKFPDKFIKYFDKNECF